MCSKPGLQRHSPQNLHRKLLSLASRSCGLGLENTVLVHLPAFSFFHVIHLLYQKCLNVDNCFNRPISTWVMHTRYFLDVRLLLEALRYLQLIYRSGYITHHISSLAWPLLTCSSSNPQCQLN